MLQTIETYWLRLRTQGVGYRDKQIVKGAAGTILYRGTSIAAGLVTVPVLYGYLGPEPFGIVMALLALGVAVSFGDFGIGNGLQNYIAEIQDDRARVAVALKTALVYASAVSLAVSVSVWAVIPRLDLRALFGTVETGHAELARLVLPLVILYAAQVPLSFGQRVLAAFQRLHVHSAYSTAGSVASLLAVLASAYASADVFTVVLALTAPAVLAHACALGHAIIALGLPLRRARLDFSNSLSESILLTGLIFFSVQVAFAVQLLTDNFFVSSRLGAAELADYNLMMRVIAVLVLPISAVVAPMLGGVNDALARRDGAWLQRSLVRTSRVVVLNGVVMVTLLLALAEPLLELWIGRPFELSALLLASYGAILLFQCLSIPVSVAIMTAPMLRKGAIVYLGGVTVAVALKWYALTLGGLPYFNFASATSLILLYVTPCVYLVYAVLYRGHTRDTIDAEATTNERL